MKMRAHNQSLHLTGAETAPAGKCQGVGAKASMLIRDAQIEDAKRIAKIHVRTWQRGYAGLMPAAVLKGLSIAARERFWSERLRSGDVTVLVSEIENQVVGWLVFGPSRDAEAGTCVAEIYGLYVDPAHWRRGAARSLWLEAERRLASSEFERVTLWVLEANDRGRKFYESVGCTAELDEVKVVEREGTRLPEVRYARAIRGNGVRQRTHRGDSR